LQLFSVTLLIKVRLVSSKVRVYRLPAQFSCLSKSQFSATIYSSAATT